MDPVPITVLIDSREKRPWMFPVTHIHRGRLLQVFTRREKLDAGDYSIEGFKGEIAVERKSLPDYVQSVTRARKRFNAELDLLRSHVLPLVLVEEPISWLLDRAYPGTVEVETILAHTAQISQGGTPVLFADDPPTAARLALTWMLIGAERCRKGSSPSR